jgi:hypothetical protein
MLFLTFWVFLTRPELLTSGSHLTRERNRPVRRPAVKQNEPEQKK